MPKNLCLGKSVKEPNKCKKVRGCKVASGKKRSFCRKIHNKTSKLNKSSKKSTGTVKKYSRKVTTSLKNLIKSM